MFCHHNPTLGGDELLDTSHVKQSCSSFTCCTVIVENCWYLSQQIIYQSGTWWSRREPWPDLLIGPAKSNISILYNKQHISPVNHNTSHITTDSRVWNMVSWLPGERTSDSLKVIFPGTSISNKWTCTRYRWIILYNRQEANISVCSNCIGQWFLTWGPWKDFWGTTCQQVNWLNFKISLHHLGSTYCFFFFLMKCP